MNFLYGNAVLNLPASVLTCTDATAEQFRVLLWLASDPTLAQKPAQLAKLADCTQKEAKTAIAFWCTHGVMTSDSMTVLTMADLSADAPVKTDAQKPPKKRLERADELPNYTTTELNALLEKRESLRALVDAAQQILGKLFNPSELNILIGMHDYLGMKEESVALLLGYCRNIGKTNLRAIEKFAYKMVDRGITEPDAMEEEIRTLEAMYGFEGEVRRLFGMKARALTTRENKLLRAWVEFGYGIDVVTKAYEMTIAATNEPSMPYANSIIERWHADGLKTLDEIEQAEATKSEKANSKKAGKPKGNVLGNSFDTDDFFQAALARSFADPNGGEPK